MEMEFIYPHIMNDVLTIIKFIKTISQIIMVVEYIYLKKAQIMRYPIMIYTLIPRKEFTLTNLQVITQLPIITS
jgi:hypothetical protein